MPLLGRLTDNDIATHWESSRMQVVIVR